MRYQLSHLFLALGCLVSLGSFASAATFDIAKATDLFVPSFRGQANTTYLGWDTFGAPGTSVINDTTPDVGFDAGSFVTTNGEDHQSGSLNYYSGGGSVAETISFATDGLTGTGFAAVVVQAKTLFGGWGADLLFGPIDGINPVQVLQETNANGAGQLFVKYELPGTAANKSFSISQLPGEPTSFGMLIVDTVWSPDGFAADSVIATPEPSTAWMMLLVLAGLLSRVRL